MGGLVTTHDVGLAVPDWPNSFGYNMFLLPWDVWFGSHGVFLEHTHRILGTVVGMFAMAMAIYAWWPRGKAAGSGDAGITRQARYLSLIVLLAVIVQGILGGLRVIWRELDLAIVHGCFAQLTLCLMGLTVVVTSRWWRQAPDRSEAAHGGPLYRLAMLAVAVIFAQLVVGAIMRHYKAGLAIPDLPLAYGQLVPPVSEAGLERANLARAAADEAALTPVTLGQIWLHYGHRLGAIAVTAVLVPLIHRVRRHAADAAGIRPFGITIGVLLVVQITLGLLTVYWRKPADITSTHVAVGALLLLTTFMLTVRLHRLYASRKREPMPEPIVTGATGGAAVLAADH